MPFLKAQKFDVALVDLMMPGISGLKLAKMMREEDPEMKIVLMTGLFIEGDAKVEEAKLDGVLQKPFGREEINKAVTDALG